MHRIPGRYFHAVQAKKRKTGAEDSMVQITRPPFLSRKSLQAAAKGDNMVYTFGGKTAEEIFKDPAKIKPTTKNNRELLADRGNTGKGLCDSCD